MFGWFRKKAPAADNDLDTDRAAEFFRRGDFREALRRADVILVAGPHIALSWRFKGECLFSLQRYAEAVECFDKAGTLGGPGTDELFLWKSLSLYNGGQAEAARQVIRDFLASGAGTPQLVAQAKAALGKLEARA
jgi:tetratricopeptide (TPR) repeat protein